VSPAPPARAARPPAKEASPAPPTRPASKPSAPSAPSTPAAPPKPPAPPAPPAPLPRRLALAVAALRALAVVGLLAGAASVRVVVAGEREIAESSAALRRGDPYAAAVHARRAAGWYAPGAPHVGVAYERLVALATTSEGLGNAEIALLAWRAVRTAATETRWLVTPHEDDLARANAAIARLSAAAPRPPGTRTDPVAAVEREQLEALARDEAPRVGWVVVLVAGFAAWVAGAAWVVRRAVTVTGQWVWRRATPGLVVCGAGVAAWLLAIWRA
jgi:hypothetical protein